MLFIALTVTLIVRSILTYPRWGSDSGFGTLSPSGLLAGVAPLAGVRGSILLLDLSVLEI